MNTPVHINKSSLSGKKQICTRDFSCSSQVFFLKLHIDTSFLQAELVIQKTRGAKCILLFADDSHSPLFKFSTFIRDGMSVTLTSREKNSAGVSAKV